MSGEFAFIDRIRTGVPSLPDGFVGIGDDAAVLPDGSLLAIDTMVEGVHFDLSWCGPDDVGAKAIAVNVSDIAAMGGRPVACVVGVTVPRGSAAADGIMAGLTAAAARFGAPVVGGDTTSGPTLVVSVAILGTAGPGGAILRSGAVAGDTVFVTGVLGLATSALDALRADDLPPSEQASIRLHRPEPRIAEGVAAAGGGATAMIDISDGLAADLGHLCDASGIGVRIDVAALPLAPGIGLDRALTGGDDYELCFTAPDPVAVRRAFTAAHLSPPTVIGTVVPVGDGRVLHDEHGDRPLPTGGFEHPVD